MSTGPTDSADGFPVDGRAVFLFSDLGAAIFPRSSPFLFRCVYLGAAIWCAGGLSAAGGARACAPRIFDWQGYPGFLPRAQAGGLVAGPVLLQVGFLLIRFLPLPA